MEKKVVKDVLEDIVFGPSFGYAGMSLWGAYVNNLGGFFSRKRWSYLANVEKFVDGFPEGLQGFVESVALDPGSYAIGTAFAFLAIGALDLIITYRDGIKL